ncbi:MAG: hypothetical protein ACREDK_04385 [Thermoplasmata archaeon]
MSATSVTSGMAHGTPRPDWAERGMRSRIILSIVGPIAWLSFTLLYVGFWATGFSIFQSIIILLVSILILGGLMGSVWTAWGLRHHPEHGWWD